jgi:hypothetical protein
VKTGVQSSLKRSAAADFGGNDIKEQIHIFYKFIKDVAAIKIPAPEQNI